MDLLCILSKSGYLVVELMHIYSMKLSKNMVKY